MVKPISLRWHAWCIAPASLSSKKWRRRLGHSTLPSEARGAGAGKIASDPSFAFQILLTAD